MKNSINLFILTASIAISNFSLAQTQPELLSCPFTNTGPFNNSFREKAIALLSQGKYETVVNSFKSCYGERIVNGSIITGHVPKCLQATEAYAKAQFTGQEESGDPSPMVLKSTEELPIEFQVKDDAGNIIPNRVDIPANIFEIAKEKGWLVIDYKTRSTGGFDQAPNLVLVVIRNFKPGQDIYLQISPPPSSIDLANQQDPKPNPRNLTGQETLTIITADRNNRLGQLRLLNRPGSDEKGYQWNNELRGKGDCTSCHSVPLRAISPRGFGHVMFENPMSPEDQRTVTEINQLMRLDNFKWGFDENRKPLGVAKESQPYGWAPKNSATRTKEFIKGCYDRREKKFEYTGFGSPTVTVTSKDEELKDWTRISNAMNCTGCHNDKKHGKLHSEFSLNEMNFKVLIDRSMPLEADLTDDERLGVMSCVKEEFEANRQAWLDAKEWLREVNCEVIPGLF